MFEFEACEVFETKELTFVSDCFKYERNEEIGHYRQTLIIDYCVKHSNITSGINKLSRIDSQAIK